MRDHSLIQELMAFLDASPTAWHAVDHIKKRLTEHGFELLKEEDKWALKKGQAYLVTRNDSALCAFITPLSSPRQVRLLASHTDSPGFKLKPTPEIRKYGAILLATEIYGAPLLTSWLNRDLGLAGRVIYEDAHHRTQMALVQLDQFPFTIPQLAIHLDREVNEKGLVLNKQEHLNALAGLERSYNSSEPYLEFLLKTAIDFKTILNFDLFFYPLEKARLIGCQKALLASYRLDSLASVSAATSALLESSTPLRQAIKMICFWDNEEVGSNTAQGAASPFVGQILERIVNQFELDREDYFRLISQSLCVSIDLAHALHPNYADKHDPQHQLFLSKGVGLKSHAQQRYASDARSSVPLQRIAKNNSISLQRFVSRNDVPCGTTIGPIHASLLGMPTVDIGCGQLSMHSCRELMACQDYVDSCHLLKATLNEPE